MRMVDRTMIEVNIHGTLYTRDKDDSCFAGDLARKYGLDINLHSGDGRCDVGGNISLDNANKFLIEVNSDADLIEYAELTADVIIENV